MTAVISSPALSTVSMCGVSPGRRWKSAIGICASLPSGCTVSTVGVERPHGDRHVAGMRGDAGVARADDGVLPAEAADGRAAAARLPLVAGLVGVVEIGAARALQQVAGRGRLVAQLAGGAGDQRAREHAVVAPHALVGGEIGVAHQRADAQAALRRRLDLVEAKAVHIDQVRRRLDLELHQVEQVGAAGDELRAGVRAAAAAASAARCARS